MADRGRQGTFDEYLHRKLKNSVFKKKYKEGSLELDLAIKIIKLRKGKKLTQSQFAELMGTSQEAISRIESGDYDGFTLKTLMKIADATGTELEIDFKRKVSSAGSRGDI